MDKERLSSAALKAVLNKYIKGLASPEEVQQVEQWYVTFTEEEIHPAEKEELRRQIVSGIMQQVPAARKNNWWKVAAAAAIVITAGLLFIKRDTRQPLLAAKEIATPAGSRKMITLSDGTVIHLNAGTQLTIPGDYGIKERHVSLSGEAFFEVAADPRHPFIISTGSLYTTVLGTSFNIRAYKGQEEWKIAVATGKVKVTRDQHLLSDSLTANRELAYNPTTNTTAINDLPASMNGTWRNNIFYFNNSTLTEIGEELQRQYNVPVTVTGEGKGNGHYNISFSKEPLTKVLKVLSGLTGITYTINKNEVIIHKQAD